MSAALPLFRPLAASNAPVSPDAASRKQALETLLRERRLQRDAPPLRGQDRRLRPLPTGLAAIDALLGGGFPRGQLSQLHGPASSGRTALLVALLARVTASGALAAVVDPLDSLDPSSLSAAGAELERLLWLRGPRVGGDEPSAKALADAVAALATLAGSGLFDLVSLDLVGAARARHTLPATTWLRLQRLVEETPTALVVLCDGPIACSPGGATLALEPLAPSWTGEGGASRLLAALGVRVRAGRQGLRSGEIALAAPA